MNVNWQNSGKNSPYRLAVIARSKGLITKEQFQQIKANESEKAQPTAARTPRGRLPLEVRRIRRELKRANEEKAPALSHPGDRPLVLRRRKGESSIEWAWRLWLRSKKPRVEPVAIDGDGI